MIKERKNYPKATSPAGCGGKAIPKNADGTATESSRSTPSPEGFAEKPP